MHYCLFEIHHLLAIFGHQWKTEVKWKEEANGRRFLWRTDSYSYKQSGKTELNQMMKIENAQFMQESWLVLLLFSCSFHNEENSVTLFIMKWHVCIYIALPLYCCNALKFPAPPIYEGDVIIPRPVNVFIFAAYSLAWWRHSTSLLCTNFIIIAQPLFLIWIKSWNGRKDSFLTLYESLRRAGSHFVCDCESEVNRHKLPPALSVWAIYN